MNSMNENISGDARVSEDARVSGNASVFGTARVSGNACVSGNAYVSGNANISGDALIKTTSDYCVFQNFGRTNNTTTAFIDSKIGIRVNCGCFTGSLAEFKVAVITTHRLGSKHRKSYDLIIKLIKHQLKRN